MTQLKIKGLLNFQRVEIRVRKVANSYPLEVAFNILKSMQYGIIICNIWQHPYIYYLFFFRVVIHRNSGLENKCEQENHQ